MSEQVIIDGELNLDSDFDGLPNEQIIVNVTGASKIIDKASGKIVSIVDGAENEKLLSAIVNIEPVQDLHGYDYPWPDGGGKNQLGYMNNVVTQSGVTLTAQADGTLLVNGTATANAAFIFNATVAANHLTLAPGTYVVSGFEDYNNANCYIGVNVNSESGAYTATSKSTASFTVAQGDYVYPRIRIASGASFTNYVLKPMIRLSSAPSAWEPYSNICPISGWTQVNVTRTGANLLPDSSTMGSWAAGGNATISDGVVTATGSTTNYNTSLSTAKMGLELLDGTTYYTLSILYKSVSNFNLVTQITGSPTGLDDSALTRSRYVNWQSAPNLPNTNGEWRRFTYTSRTISPDELINGSGDVLSWFMRFYFRSDATISIKNVQIEFGQAATAYQDSSVQRKTISLNQTVYGGTLDVASGKLVVDRGYATISAFTSKSGATANMVYAYQGITSTVKKPSADSVAVDLLSDKFVKSNFGSTGGLYGTDKLGIAVNTNGTVYVGFGKNGVSTLADANTWVAANPIQVVYPLATPLEYDVSPQTIKTLKGTNNIWADAGSTEIEYVADTKLYIQRLTAPTEDDMIANENIASGKFFMIGNDLYLSTLAIVAGETIAPGTNCTKLSLAEALNNINA